MGERALSGIAALFCCAVLFGAAQASADDDEKKSESVTFKISGMT